MKKNKLLIVLVLGLMAFSSCTETDPVDPDVDPRDKFLGTWNVQENIDGQVSGAYQSEITNDQGNTSRIRIGNIYNLGAATGVNALVAGNSLDINSQSVTGVTIVGTGLFANSGFTLNYTANDGAQSNIVQAIYTR
ncbi:MAG: hypothetical protein WED33_12580 [Bacteroidia bacterium]